MPVETKIDGDFVPVMRKPVTYEGFEYRGDNPLVLDQPQIEGTAAQTTKITAYKGDWIFKLPNGRFAKVTEEDFRSDWFQVEEEVEPTELIDRAGLNDRQREAIDEIARLCWEVAEASGFHEPRDHEGVMRDSSPPERMMLVVSEVSEALEAYRRDGSRANSFWLEADHKPEGVAIEMIDALIRILDYCVIYGISVSACLGIKMAYNTTRPYRHGMKYL